MKSLIFKSLVLIVITGGIINYFAYVNTGQPLFFSNTSALPDTETTPTLFDVVKSHSSNLVESISDDSMSLKHLSSNEDGKQTVYKWTDETGQVHYSSEPVDNAFTPSAIVVDPNTNIVPATQDDSKYDRSAQENPTKPTSSPSPSLPNNQIQKILDEAKSVQNLMDQRTQTIDQAID